MGQHQLYRVKSIAGFHKLKGLPPPWHPLISVFDFETFVCSREINNKNFVFDFYHISIKRIDAAFKYGQGYYGFHDGVMFFIAPNQVFGIEKIQEIASTHSGWVLMVHPDFLYSTTLAKNISRYEFFDYAVNEALFLSDKEEETLNAIVKNIKQECKAGVDSFSQGIMISQFETLLGYCARFYQRQFFARRTGGDQLLDKVQKTIEDYFNDQNTPGLPTVQFVARSLNISPMYLSRLLKSLTGMTTQEHIHGKLIEKAKEKLSTTELRVSEIAFELGFEHSQSFSKLFKNKTSISPVAFRSSFG